MKGVLSHTTMLSRLFIKKLPYYQRSSRFSDVLFLYFSEPLFLRKVSLSSSHSKKRKERKHTLLENWHHRIMLQFIHSFHPDSNERHFCDEDMLQNINQ